MDFKGANPFLFAEEEFTSPHSNTSNPFLISDEDFENVSSINDNPFLSQAAVAVASNFTNPFAFDPMDLGPAEAHPAENSCNFSDNQIVQTISSNSASVDLFNNSPPVQDLECDTSTTFISTPQKPVMLDLKHMNTVASTAEVIQVLYSSDDEVGKPSGPPRPPPPRPPPSKETQDLLISVMGAMDATSSHLLDKIPPTRTPSPVSMRDLHSPSPTPEPTYIDLLDVSDAKIEANVDVIDNNKINDSLMLAMQETSCDINQNPPEPPSRPPRPQPPQKPPPPLLNQMSKTPPPTNVILSTTEQHLQPSEDMQHEMMDLFGSEDVQPQKTIASTAEIMSLYSAPVESKPELKTTDLLFDTIENNEITHDGNVVSFNLSSPGSVANVQTDDNLSSNTEVKDNLESVSVILDNFLSPEPSPADLQMDTSDSMSKGSVSSVTFNPFAASEDAIVTSPNVQNTVVTVSDICDLEAEVSVVQKNVMYSNETNGDVFDDFAAKFESAAKDENINGVIDPFSSKNNAWGNQANGCTDNSTGFGTEEPFDCFLNMKEPPAAPQTTPNKLNKDVSQDSDDDKDFSVFIKPKSNDEGFENTAMPILAPPPSGPVVSAFSDTSPRFNPFDQQTENIVAVQESVLPFDSTKISRTDSQETPPTPLFDEDVSQPLENFPRTIYTEDGWEMQLRQPNKKKITGQRFWKKIFVRIVHQMDCILLQLFNQQSDKDPFQELPLQPCYSVSEIGAQQYDQYGKIFTVKLQYIFYKERPGVRPGQVKKAERITNKLSQFAAYAIQGDYQGVKEFGSDLKKLGLPVEHAPQVSQLMKLGSLNYEDLKQFSVSIEEALFKLQAHRDRALHYKMEEVQITAVDELYVEQHAEGNVEKQVARVRLFFLGFLTGMPDIELGVNDMRRQGKEVVGRHDIIPVITEEWIRLEEVEFHSCVQQEEYNNTHIIKFKPPDACYIEIIRFRVRPPKNRELPLQLKATMCITGNKVELRADVLVPGFASRKLGQVPCEDVMIRYPIPECWIYLFRVEKHFRYGSVKSAHRRSGKIKGIERFLGTVETLQESLIEVTSGQAKYEHQHRAIVWRCPRLPKEGQGAYTTHNMACRLALTSYDQVPDQLPEYCYVEFTMPATQVSHTTVRSVSLQNSDSDEPPEKYVRYLARHEYKVGIDHTESEGPTAYVAATVTRPTATVQEEPQPIVEAESSSDSD